MVFRRILKDLFSVFITAALLLIQTNISTVHAAGLSITNGMNATGVIGQFDDDLATGLFTKSGSNNGPSKYGFNTPYDTYVDSDNNRLFVSEWTNNRVLVYDLDSNGDLVDSLPDYVLGQPDFNTNVATATRSGMYGVFSLEFDSNQDLLFVGDSLNNRVLVFDLSSGITNGMNASYVLGQPDFTSNATANTQNGLTRAHALAYDAASRLLFVAETNANRVKIFDLSNGITNGMDASYVIGQAGFTSAAAAVTQAGLREPKGLAYDSVHELLFVAQDFGANRISVFDLSNGITNGMDAANVIGQAGFTTGVAANTQAGFNRLVNMDYDESSGLLFAAEATGNRIKIFDLSSGITNGMNASYVLGQPDFISAAASTSQSGLRSPYTVSHDSANERLYVSDAGNNRIMIFDLSGGITNGMEAVGVLGQFEDGGITQSFAKSGTNNGPNRFGLVDPRKIEMDIIGKRLFATDETNNRVLVYNLNPDNTLIDSLPDYVLGQASFNTNSAGLGASGLTLPRGLEYDAENERLFIVQSHRITVFDLSNGIANGMDASYVLGQPDFDTYVTTFNIFTQSNLNNSYDAIYDPSLERLYVTELGANKIKVFDLSNGITNGMDASYVLGQADFTSNVAAVTQSSTRQPVGLAFDTENGYLFVAQISTASRVSVFDVSGAISDNMPATYVIGQPDFVTGTQANGLAGLRLPQGVGYSDKHDLLFVADTAGHRVKVFDLSNGIANGMDASYVLGQAGFTTAAAATTQSGMSGVRGAFFDDTRDILYVADYSNSRIVTFSLSDGTPEPEVASSSSPAIVSANHSAARTAVSSAAISQAEVARIFGLALVADPADTGCAPGNAFSTRTGTACPASSISGTAEAQVSAIGASAFTRNLMLGSTGADVQALQRFLNNKGFSLAPAPQPGSAGNETTYFGPATRSALSRFQAANGISPAVGYFGPVTRGFLKIGN
ncbi:MAG TPA: peptidoglycan-binding protein [Candidatus Paceibacterota bacterium]